MAEGSWPDHTVQHLAGSIGLLEMHARAGADVEALPVEDGVVAVLHRHQRALGGDGWPGPAPPAGRWAMRAARRCWRAATSARPAGRRGGHGARQRAQASGGDANGARGCCAWCELRETGGGARTSSELGAQAEMGANIALARGAGVVHGARHVQAQLPGTASRRAGPGPGCPCGSCCARSGRGRPGGWTPWRHRQTAARAGRARAGRAGCRRRR